MVHGMSDHENEPDVEEPDGDDDPSDESESNEGGRPIAEI
jgi:hypothetical protein